MAAAVHSHMRRTSRYTNTSGGWETTDTLAAATLTGDGFATNDDVVVFFFAVVTSATAGGGEDIRLRVTYNGTALQPAGDEVQYKPNAADEERAFAWMSRVDLGGTVSDFDVDIDLTFGTADVYLDKMELLVVRLSDFGTENTDWFWNDDDDDASPTDFGTTWGSKASVTFTPGSVEDWVVFGAAHQGTVNAAQSHQVRLALDGSAIAGEFLEEGESTNEHKQWLLFDVVPSLSAASHTIAVQTQAESTSVASHYHSSVFVFKAGTFADVYIDEAGTVACTNDTDTQVATITNTLSATQDVVMFGAGNIDMGRVGDDGWMWVEDGGTAIEPLTEATAGPLTLTTFDNTDEWYASVMAFKNIASGALDLDLYFHHNSNASKNLLVTKFLVWGMELAGAQTISPALVSQLATASAPQLNMEMTPALTSQTLTTFAPQANLGMAPALVTQTATAFDPTLTTGPVQIDPALVSQLVAAFAPAFTVTVAPALVSQTLTVFDPSQLWRSIDPALVTQLATPFDPTVSVSGGTQQIDPTLVSQLATASAPQVNLAIAPALVSQLVAASDPQLNLAVAPALVSQLLTSFDPSQLSRTIDPALVTQLAAASDPSLSIQVAPGLVTQTVTAFAPTFAITVAPALVSQLVAASDPSFTITIDPVLVSQLLAASDPTVSLSTGQQIDPALVSQLITAFAFVIMGHARYIEGAGAASRIEAGTVVSGIREGRISATGRIG